MGESNSAETRSFWIEFAEDEDGVGASEGKDLSGPSTDGTGTGKVIDLTRFDFDKIVLGRGKNNEKVPSGRRKLRAKTKA